jgi:hypothetical protein
MTDDARARLTDEQIGELVKRTCWEPSARAFYGNPAMPLGVTWGDLQAALIELQSRRAQDLTRHVK